MTIKQSLTMMLLAGVMVMHGLAHGQLPAAEPLKIGDSVAFASHGGKGSLSLYLSKYANPQGAQLGGPGGQPWATAQNLSANDALCTVTIETDPNNPLAPGTLLASGSTRVRLRFADGTYLASGQNLVPGIGWWGGHVAAATSDINSTSFVLCNADGTSGNVFYGYTMRICPAWNVTGLRFAVTSNPQTGFWNITLVDPSNKAAVSFYTDIWSAWKVTPGTVVQSQQATTTPTNVQPQQQQPQQQPQQQQPQSRRRR